MWRSLQRFSASGWSSFSRGWLKAKNSMLKCPERAPSEARGESKDRRGASGGNGSFHKLGPGGSNLAQTRAGTSRDYYSRGETAGQKGQHFSSLPLFFKP